MQGEPPLHRVTIGRTREVRGPDAFERAAVGVVIAIATLFAVRFGVHQIRMAEVTEAVSIATGVERDEIVYRAVHGHWPSPRARATLADGMRGAYVTHTQLGSDGAITMQLALGPRRWNAIATSLGVADPTTGMLSLRLQAFGVPGSQSVTLMCGYAIPIGSVRAWHGTNETTLDRRDLPPLCR